MSITKLPDEQTKSLRPMKPWIVFGAVALLLLAVNQWYRSPDFANTGWQIVQHKWNMLRGISAAPDWLVLGDSSGGHGVVPEVISRELGGSCLNLCTVGDMTIMNDAWMLDTLIRRGIKPRNVILVHVYDVFSRDDKALRTYLNAVAETGKAVRQLTPALSMSSPDWAQFYGTEWVPLYFRNLTLAARLKHPWRRPSGGDLLSALSPSGLLADEKALPDAVLKDYRQHMEKLSTGISDVSDLNRLALEHLQALAHENNINLIWAWSPVYSGLAFEPLYQKQVAELELALSDYTELKILSGLQRSFGAEEMSNVDHLTAGSAVRYTENLTAVIRAAQ